MTQINCSDMMFSVSIVHFYISKKVSEHIGGERKLLSILVGCREYIARLWDGNEETYVSINNLNGRNTYAEIL